MKNLDIRHIERRGGLSIIHFMDGSTTITSSLVDAHKTPPEPKVIIAPHGNSKELRALREQRKAELRASRA